jgi:hypothetical protein
MTGKRRDCSDAGEGVNDDNETSARQEADLTPQELSAAAVICARFGVIAIRTPLEISPNQQQPRREDAAGGLRYETIVRPR